MKHQRVKNILDWSIFISGGVCLVAWALTLAQAADNATESMTDAHRIENIALPVLCGLAVMRGVLFPAAKQK